jgi:hypothetical protein
VENPRETSVKPHDTAENVTCALSKKLPQEPQSVTIEGGKKNTPGPVLPTPGQGLTHSNEQTEGGANLSIVSQPSKTAQEYALQFLQYAAEDYTQSIDRREYYAVAARRLGIRYQQIADIYGLTEGAVRAMVKRANTSERG